MRRGSLLVGALLVLACGRPERLEPPSAVETSAPPPAFPDEAFPSAVRHELPSPAKLVAIATSDDKGITSHCGLLDSGHHACWYGPSECFPQTTAACAPYELPVLRQGCGVGGPRVTEGLDAGVDEIIPGCALKRDGEIRCRRARSPIRYERIDLGGAGATDIQGSWMRGCALRTDGRVSCWRWVAADGHDAPPRIRDVEGVAGARVIDYAQGRGCAIDGDGALLCWKDGSATRTRGIERAVDVAVSAGGVCAIDQAGALSCGDGERVERAEKFPPSGASRVRAVMAVRGGFCAHFEEDGELLCFGGSRYPEAGIVVSTFPSGLRDVVSFGRLDCAITDRATTCWDPTENPLRPRSFPIAALSSRCLLTRDGRVSCYGAMDPCPVF